MQGARTVRVSQAFFSVSSDVAAVQRPDRGADPRPENAKTRILIVDDIADNRTILGRRFRRRNFDVVEAEGGAKALDLMRESAFDAILLDIRMPDIDGFEVLRQIRLTHSLELLPVIMITAKNESADIVEALELGANDYLSKPIKFEVALVRLQVQLDRKRDREVLLETNEKLKEEIAARAHYEAQTRYLAYHDTLTGLGNRHFFQEELSRRIGDAQGSGALAVLFLDLDGFKFVNDTHGHSVGDALLKTVARRMADSLDDQVQIARVGGDEFAVIQTARDQPNAAIRLGKQLLELVRAPCRIEPQLAMTVTASVGIAICDETNRDAESLVRTADLAMYCAKAEGGGVSRVYELQMDAAAQALLLLKTDLRNALLNSHFEVHYQPMISTATRRVTGFEALARWRHHERGWISPAEFIRVAENAGLITQLGEWVLRRACADAAAWPDDLKVAVNLSASQFENGNLTATVMSALAASGLAPRRLELEITESVLLEGNDNNLAILRQLRDLGVRISLDDFGTGFSSLSYLRSFPFDKIKIDQSFIRNLLDDARSETIVSAIVALSVSFGSTTTAEGVETESQMEHLIAKGCTEVQGFFYSRPVPDCEVVALVERINGSAPRPGC